MSKSINADDLRSLADKIWGVLDDHGIDAEVFSLSVRVSPEFYGSIKENFPNRHPIDMIVSSSEKNWNISLMVSPYES